MKRSEINDAIIKAKIRLDEYKISLPAFGYWNMENWKNNYDSVERIKERMLGWDVTDFGSNDFKSCGAVLFTLRNGDKNDKECRAPYAEKYIILDDSSEQQIPFHYHREKTEDIINRGGGILIIELYNRKSDTGLDEETNVTFYMDGIKCTAAPGEKVRVTPGNSITIEPFVYHRFYAEKNMGMLIAGEVSKVNDDDNDNVFLETSERFCQIDEDKEILHPLVKDYKMIDVSEKST